MEPIVSISLPVSLNQHRSHGPIFRIYEDGLQDFTFSKVLDVPYVK